MRLLRFEDGGGLSLVEFIANIPPYAILSHTWGADGEEVTFKDLMDGTGKSKAGHDKIRCCGEQAAKDGLEFFWVDTCCIDKSSSAELSEAINSMFNWYRDAVVCYIYLADLPPHSPPETELSGCRWFTRGWTLQELVAPAHVEFFDTDWNHLGTKLELIDIISENTWIAPRLLLGEATLSDYSVARRMSWAARRQTTRVEDLAYCLLGIFEVNMPLIYGEGMRAFRRLQEEIVKHNNDLTIFAWDVPQESKQRFVGLIAPSPSAFIRCPGIVPFEDDFANFSVTNKGLFLSGDIPLRAANVTTEGGRVEKLYSIFLGLDLDTGIDGGIYLRKIGPRLFCRDGLLPLAGFREEADLLGTWDVTEIGYILLDPTQAIPEAYSSFRNLAIHIPSHEVYHLTDAIPVNLLDLTDRLFLRPNRYDWAFYPTVLAMKFDVRIATPAIPLIVLCDYRKRIPSLKAFSPDHYSRESSIIFQERYREETIHWEELDLHAPGIRAVSDTATVRVGPDLYHISVSLQKQKAQCLSGEVEVLSLAVSVVRTFLPLIDLSLIE
ncbi:HET-domain-containing protein [Trematosphaeria pertusa]|uniref:HET-domain-containing protein n=1 Tax=Trematosphaeria pertusa TaxID=390896 RepID=A0A6A6IY97_9PLEO|nr:HET-domain-containing protein [Trematosphaeria pertusa]KAF2255007.1 HET-domain-containing protein [Trematosphaeria pertusa]